MIEKKPVIILGAKGLGKVALEIFKSNEMVVYGFLDEDKSLHQTEIDFISVLGDVEDDGFLKLIGIKCDAFVAMDDNKYRKSLIELLLERRKVMPTNAIHQTAFVAESAQFGYGNLMNMGVKVGSQAKIANHCIFNAGVVLDYEVEVEDFVQIGAGSIISSNVKIEEGAFIGAGVVIVSGVTIGKNARIGAGSVVVADVKAKETVFGNPAKAVG